MLMRIKAFLKERKRASLRELALHCDVSESAMEKMVVVWIDKGKVVRVKNKSCAGCAKRACDQGMMTVYEWCADAE